LNEAVQLTAKSGIPYSIVMQTARGANGVRFVRGEGRARRDEQGNISGLFGTVIDITAAIEREAALLQAQERAEAASKSKSEFLANMSHEIRTPLTAILGYTDLLRDDAIRQGAPSEQLQSMSTIRRAGEHLLTVINDILDLSKIEAGRMELQRVETDLPRVLADIDSLMRSRAARKGVQLQTRLLTPIPDRVVTDPTRVRQILMNLVGNAEKFTATGQIEIQVEVSTLAGQPALRIAVIDTGAGMTADAAALLFQPFMQADTSVTRKHEGTGLGLTICRRLAYLMGGEVELLKTAPGEGSTFTFTLPLHRAVGAQDVADLRVSAGNATQQDAGASGSELRGRVLLAEDGEDNQLLISHHLRKAGAEVVVAEHGNQALEFIAEADNAGRPFGLLVTDMQMPEMDGYTLARTLRAKQHAIPIVALTAHAMAEDRQKCLDAGCNDYASKPIDRATLIATCARWMLMPMDTAVDRPGSVEVLPPPALYSELRDDPEFARLIDAFVSGLPAKIARLDEVFHAGSLLELARLAHQLKGAAGGYGYPSISEAARPVERYARARVTADGTFDPGVDLSEAVALLLGQCRLAVRTLESAT